jgi:acetyltransferase-like isoleucine patch superfamily enzyme
MNLWLISSVLLRKSFATTARFHLRMQGVRFGQRLVLYGRPLVSMVPTSHIIIGNRVVLCSQSRYTALGVNHPVVLRTLKSNARIEIGDDVGISGGTICAAEAVTIGACTMFGANVTVVDNDFHPLTSTNRRYCNEGIRSAPVVIGRNVFVGTGAVILKGVHIGDNSIIGASSVVTSDLPANVIAAGNPCKTIAPLPRNEECIGATL